MDTARPIAVLILILIAAAPLVAGGQEYLSPSRDYLSCPCTRDMLTVSLVRNALTGRTLGILLYKPDVGTYIVWNNLPPDMRILAASIANGSILTVVHDAANGTIVVFESQLGADIQLADTITKASTRVVTVGLEGGFIKKAYARAHNRSITVLASAVFVEGNKSVNHIVVLKINVNKVVTAEARGQPVDTEGLALEGSETCMPVLVRATNTSLDIAPLMSTKGQGATIYHVPFKTLPKPDTLSIIAQPRLTGSIVVTHPYNATDKIMVIDLDVHESKAYVYISEPVPGIASFEPKIIQRVNDTAYAIYGLGLTPQAKIIPLLVIFEMGLNPRSTVYYLEGRLAAPVDTGNLLLITSGEAQMVPLGSIGSYATGRLELRMDRATVGLTMEPFRLTREYATTVSVSTIVVPGNATNTTSTSETQTQEQAPAQQEQPAPAPVPGDEGSTARKIVGAVIVIGVVSVAGFLAYRLLRTRLEAQETLGEAVFRI